MTVEGAYNRAMAELRAEGFDFGGKDRAAIAGFLVFERRAASKQFDPRFPADAPRYARQVILESYIVAAGGHHDPAVTA